MTRIRTAVLLALIVVLAALAGYCVRARPRAAERHGDEQLPSAAPKPAIDPALRQAIDELTARWEGVQALSLRLRTEIPNAGGMKGWTKGEGTYDLLRTEGTSKTRFWVFNNLSLHMENKNRKKTAEVVMQVFDGQHLFLLNQQFEYQKVTKAKYDPARVLHFGGKNLFDSIVAESKVRLLPPESVDGREAVVLEEKPLDGSAVIRHWFDKETGMRIRLTEVGADGTQRLTLSTSDVNTAPEFAPDRFVFTLPDGFELTDETVPPVESVKP